MDDLNPLEGTEIKPSLDRSKSVNPNRTWEDLRPIESFAEFELWATKRLKFCPSLNVRSGLVVAGPESDVSRIDFLGGCKKWTCDVCGPKKRYRLIKRIGLGNPNRFMTLTVAPRNEESPREAFVRTSKQVSKLFRWLKKTDPKIQFARILESTKAGFPHYHFALNSKWISQINLSNEWERLTGARIVDIRKLHSAHLQYLAKYITKSDTVSYTRQRVSFSRGWPKLEKQDLECDLAEWSTTWNEDVQQWADDLAGSTNVRDMGKTAIAHVLGPSESQAIKQLAKEWPRRYLPD